MKQLIIVVKPFRAEAVLGAIAELDVVAWAVREAKVFCINDEYLNTPAPTLLMGLHAIEATIHGSEAGGLRRIALNQTTNQ